MSSVSRAKPFWSCLAGAAKVTCDFCANSSAGLPGRELRCAALTQFADCTCQKPFRDIDHGLSGDSLIHLSCDFLTPYKLQCAFYDFVKVEQAGMSAPELAPRSRYTSACAAPSMILVSRAASTTSCYKMVQMLLHFLVAEEVHWKCPAFTA